MREQSVRIRRGASLVVAGLAWLLVGGPATAGDGRVEINQACALAGCGGGDDPGFPVTLAAGGNFVLTSDLVVTPTTANGVVLGDRAALDLAGFAIRGPVTCGDTGSGLTCTTGGSGVGITAGFGSTIHGGTVRGMGLHGIVVTDAVEVYDMVSEQNGHAGISVGASNDAILIHDCRVQANGGAGIAIALYANPSLASLVRNVLAYQNGGVAGLDTDAALVVGSVSSFNEGWGYIGTGAIGGNTFANNGAGPRSGGVQLGINGCSQSPCQ